VTTLVDLSVPSDGWLDALAEWGIRACIAPMYRDPRWLTLDSHSLEYEWDTRCGRSPLGTRSAARASPALPRHHGILNLSHERSARRVGGRRNQSEKHQAALDFSACRGQLSKGAA
jgi:hypothetical protein